MKSTNKLILYILYVISWIIFIGISIDAGGFIANCIFSIAKPDVVKHLWHKVDLDSLFNYNITYFFTLTCLMSIVTVMKAILFYLIVRMLHKKMPTIATSFDREVGRCVTLIAYVSLGIGLFSLWGINYSEGLAAQGVNMPDARALQLDGADVWLFMTVILFVISYIYKRGIEIQEEHELTV